MVSVPSSTQSSTLTALPALTTIFRPPSYCLSNVASVPYPNLAPSAEYPQCYPYSASSGLTFSPGICPDEYTSIYQSQKVLQATTVETEFGCCPRYLQMSLQSDFSACTVPVDTKVIWAPLIVARYQSSDTAIANSWSSILGRVVSSSASGSSSISSATPSASLSPASSSSTKLNGGAIAGIVIGAIVGFLLLLSCLLLLLRWRKRKQTAMTTYPVEERKWNDDSSQRRWEEAGESRRM